MSDYHRGKLHGINDCIAVCKHNPELKAKDVEKKLRNMIDQLEAMIGDDVQKNYLEGE